MMMAEQDVRGEIYIPSTEDADDGTLDEPVTTTLVRDSRVWRYWTPPMLSANASYTGGWVRGHGRQGAGAGELLGQRV